MNKIFCKDICGLIDNYRFGDKLYWEQFYWKKEYSKVLNQYIMCQMRYHAKIRFFDGPDTDLWFSRINSRNITQCWYELVGSGTEKNLSHIYVRWFKRYSVGNLDDWVTHNLNELSQEDLHQL